MLYIWGMFTATTAEDPYPQRNAQAPYPQRNSPINDIGEAPESAADRMANHIINSYPPEIQNQVVMEIYKRIKQRRSEEIKHQESTLQHLQKTLQDLG